MFQDRFHWGFGIEDTFIGDPHPVTGKVLDEYELTDHYRLWKEDFDRIETIGLDSVRWGIPWYRVQPEKNKWDWSFTDQVIPYIVQEKKLHLVLDLMHYGVPTWMKQAYLDPDYPQYVEAYTARVVERYGQYLRFATPYNEPHTACEFCGNRGEWPPYLSGYQGYFDVLKGVVRGTQRQTKLLQKAGIQCVQVECSGGSLTRDPSLSELADFECVQQEMFFNFLTGDFAGLEKWFPLFERYGLTESDLKAFEAQRCTIDIMGINFYPQFSYQNLSVQPDGKPVRTNCQLWTEDLKQKILNRYARFHCPMMITETSVRDDEEMKKRWLQEASRTVFELYQNQIPVYGFFWFPIIDMYDWEYRIHEGPKEDFKARFGFYNQQRQANPCVEIYRSIVKEVGR